MSALAEKGSGQLQSGVLMPTGVCDDGDSYREDNNLSPAGGQLWLCRQELKENEQSKVLI